MKVKHCIQMRFSVPMDGYEITDEWLDYRFTIFEEVTLPSLLQQTNKNFELFCYFNENTSQRWKEKIETYTKIFTPIFTKSIGQANHYFSQMDQNFEYLLTTRLDSDDAIALNHIEIVQENFEEVNNKILNLWHGYKILYPTFSTQKLIHPVNSFISLIEKAEKNKIFLTAMGIWHTYIYGYGNVKQINTQNPMWLMNIHGDNIKNEIVPRDLKNNQEMLETIFSYNPSAFYKNHNETLLIGKRVLFKENVQDLPVRNLTGIVIRNNPNGLKVMMDSYFEDTKTRTTVECLSKHLMLLGN